MFFNRKILFFLLLLLLTHSIKGQVILTPTQLPQGSISIDKPFFIQLNNNQNNILTGQLQITLTEGQNQLAVITYQQLQLQQGITTINTSELSKISENISSTALQTSRTITQGEIQLCFSFINSFDNTELGNHCANIVLNKKEQAKSNKKPLPISFTGYAEISGNYANRQGSYQNLPANYTNIILNPQLELFGIPMGARMNYSTASDKNLQNMNMFNLYFDADRFKQNMEQKYLKNLGTDYLLEKTELGDYKKKTEELTKLNKILTNPYIVTELQKIEQLDSLDKLLQDSSPYLNTERIKTIQQERDSLAPIAAKKDAYQSLLQKQKTLASVVNIYENPVDIKLLKDSLTQLEEKLNTTRNPFSDQDEQRLKNADSLLSDTQLSKSRREVLKQQRDRLYANKTKKEEYETLKENYAQLHHTYEYKSKLDSIRKQRGDFTSVYTKDSAKELLRDPSKLKDKFEFLKSFKSINFGFFAPYTSELTLNGVPIRGGGAELQFKKIFLGAAYGKLQRNSGFTIENNSPTPFERKMLSAWVGLGQQNSNFISLQLIDAKDLGNNTIISNDSMPLFYANTGKNKVLSTQFKASFFKGKTTLQGEVAGSQIRDNQTTTLITENGATNQTTTNNWIANIINQKSTNGVRVGYGYKVSLTQQFNKNTTILTLTSKKVAPTYVSFGNPFILTDIFMNDAKLTQRLWKGKVIVSGFYRATTDNLNNIKSFTTKNENFGGDLSIRIPNLPTLRVLYMPMVQQTQTNYFNTNLFTVTSTYGLRKGDYYHQWSALFTQQEAKSRIGYNNFTSNVYTANYFLSYKQKFSTSINLNRIEQLSSTPIKGYLGTISLGYIYKRKLNQQVGFTLTDNNIGNRKSYFYDVSYPVFNNLMLKVRYENTNYLSTLTSINDNSYIENLLTFSLIKKW
jgi:cytochrome c556